LGGVPYVPYGAIGLYNSGAITFVIWTSTEKYLGVEYHKMVAYIRKRKGSTTIIKGRVAKKPRLTTRRVASIAKKAVMKVTETKKHSLEKTEVVLSTNGGVSVESPLQLATGSGHGTRIGHKVNPIGLDIRGHIFVTGGVNMIAKVMVVRIKDYLATLPGELLETNSGNVTASSNDISKMYRRINADSFEVLSSKYITLVPNFTAGPQTKMFRMWIPLKKLRTLTYEGTAATTPNRNDLAIIVYAADAANDSGGSNYELSYNSTFYYKDP